MKIKVNKKPSQGFFLCLLLFPYKSIAWKFLLSFWKLLIVPSQGKEEQGSIEIWLWLWGWEGHFFSETLISVRCLGRKQKHVSWVLILHIPQSSATMRQKRVTFDIRLLPKLALWATLIFFFAALKPQDQVSALQLLVYLMPPCHSDTLERLLKALHKITENCEDSIGADGQLVKICWKG